MDSWLNSLFDAVTIYTADGNVKLKKVQRLKIANGTVCIHTQGASKIA